MPTCQIQWVDDTGQPTPDTNTAIGRVRMLARVEQHHGRGISFPASDWYFICQCHDVGDALANAARHSTVDLYRGDDGLVYLA